MCQRWYLGAKYIYIKILFGNILYPFKKIHEDEAISHRLLYSSKRVGITPQKLCYYRNRDDSIMGQNFSIKNLDLLDALNDRSSFFEENGESNLYALTLKVYAEWLPTYIYNVRLLSGDNGCIESYLYDVYSHIKKEVLRCQYLSIYDKIHMILVWAYPRCTFTVNLLDRMRRIRHKFK